MYILMSNYNFERIRKMVSGSVYCVNVCVCVNNQWENCIYKMLTDIVSYACINKR